MMPSYDYPAHMAPYHAVLDKFGPGINRGTHWYACCPCCQGQSDGPPKLSFWMGDCQKLMLGCWRNCSKPLILRAVGVTWPQLFPGKDAERFKPRATAWYDYLDANGVRLYQVVRLEWDAPDGRRKRFSQRRPDAAAPNGWAYDMAGVERVLFRLPQILGADPTRTVLVVEGEKDVLSAERVGLIATTAAGGAKAAWLDTYSEALSGRHVVVIPDADATGRQHAYEVAGSLLAHDAASVRLAGLPAKDLTALLTLMNGMSLAAQRQSVVKVLEASAQWRPARRLAERASA